MRACHFRRQLFLEDVSSAASLQRFDTLLAIAITCDGVSFFGGVHGRPLPPRYGNAATAAAKRLCRVRTRPVAPDKLRDPEMALSLMFVWRSAVQQMLDEPPPVLQTTDGEPLVLTRDIFALEATRDDITRSIAVLPGVQEPDVEDGDTVFVVTKEGNAMHQSWSNTIVGRIVLKRDRLVVETMSERRADALRAMIENGLPGLVRFRLRKEDNTDQFLAEARESAARHPPPPEARPPELLAQLRKFREQHIAEWPDQNIPALDGLTPREAARLPRFRPRLELLLKEMERSEARLPEEERIDLAALRETLGFPQQ